MSRKTTKQTTKQQGPVAKVWALASKLGKRAAVLEAAKKAGINPFTARTQWQRFIHRNDKSAKRPARRAA